MTDRNTQALRRAAAAGDAEAAEALALAMQRAEHQIDPMRFKPTIGTRRGWELHEGHVWWCMSLCVTLIGWGECEGCYLLGRLGLYDDEFWFCLGCGEDHEETNRECQAQLARYQTGWTPGGPR